MLNHTYPESISIRRINPRTAVRAKCDDFITFIVKIFQKQ